MMRFDPVHDWRELAAVCEDRTDRFDRTVVRRRTGAAREANALLDGLLRCGPEQRLPVGILRGARVDFDETAGAPVGVQQNLRHAGINGWDLTSPVIAGHTYRVTLTDGSSTIEYRTTPVDCP